MDKLLQGISTGIRRSHAIIAPTRSVTLKDAKSVRQLSGASIGRQSIAGLESQAKLCLISSRHCLKLTKDLAKQPAQTGSQVLIAGDIQRVWAMKYYANASLLELSRAEELASSIAELSPDNASQEFLNEVEKSSASVRESLSDCVVKQGELAIDVVCAIHDQDSGDDDSTVSSSQYESKTENIPDADKEPKKSQREKTITLSNRDWYWDYFMDPVFMKNEKVMSQGGVGFWKRIYNHVVLIACLQEHCREYSLEEFAEGAKGAFCRFNVALAEKDEKALRRMLTPDFFNIVLKEHVKSESPVEFKVKEFVECGGYKVREVFVTGADIDLIDDEPVFKLVAGVRADVQMEVVNTETGNVIQDGKESKPYYCELEFYSPLPGDSIDNLVWSIGSVGGP